jgi:outer membrane protein OmpA-like peptidoglycan-associated protein
MASDLLDSLYGLLTPEVTRRFAATTGESESKVSRVVGASFPLILGGLAERGSDSGVMRQVMNLVTDRGNDEFALETAGGLQPTAQRSSLMELGQRLLALVLGDRQSAVTRMLADKFDVKTSSASSLLGIASPMVLAVLGDRVRHDGLDASGLTRVLAGQRASILSAVPSGLATALGLGREVAGAAATGARATRAWLWPVLLVALALLALWALLHARGLDQTELARRAERATNDAASRVGQAAKDAGTAAMNAGAGLGALVTRHLPSNVDLSVPERGVESQVIAFVGDPARPIDANAWFNFDRLTFETGSAALKPESREQLQNIAAIMKAYPAMKVRIGGYTDNTGDPAANLKLSQARATNVMNEITALGVPADRITAEGYGEQNPIADNDTEAGRARNRRISMRVTEK